MLYCLHSMQIFFVFMGQDPCLLDVERSSLSNGEAFVTSDVYRGAINLVANNVLYSWRQCLQDWNG